MEMATGADGIAGCADRADPLTRQDPIAAVNPGRAPQVRVEVPAVLTFAVDQQVIAVQDRVVAAAQYPTAGHRDQLGAAGGDDVEALMSSPPAARRPKLPDSPPRPVRPGNRKYVPVVRPPAVTGLRSDRDERGHREEEAESEEGGALPVVLDDAVDDAVLLRLLGAHEVVALGVVRDLVEGLAGVLGDDLVEAAADVDDLFGVDLDVGRLALEAGGDLVDQDLRVRQRHPLAGGAAAEQQRTHAHRDPDADRLHVRLDELHRVVDRHAGIDGAAGRVDVEADVLVRIHRLEMEELSDDQVGDVIGDRGPQKHDPLVAKPRVDVEGTLARARSARPPSVPEDSCAALYRRRRWCLAVRGRAVGTPTQRAPADPQLMEALGKLLRPDSFTESS